MKRLLLIFLLSSLFAVIAHGNENLSERIHWQGHELEILSYAPGGAAASDRERSGEGRLAQVRLAPADKLRVPDNILAAYSHEFVLLDGDDGVYRPIEARQDTDGDSIILTYKISEKDDASDNLKLDVWRRGALWANAYYRLAARSPFRLFIPKDPRPFTYSIALDDQSMYRYDKKSAIANPDDAFDELSDELGVIATWLKEALPEREFAASDDPDLASVVIGVSVQYPLAGKYGVGGMIKAYNCVLTLTAYDSSNHRSIAALTAGAYFGNTISVQSGATATWKQVPSPAAADAEAIENFIRAVKDFWGD